MQNDQPIEQRLINVGGYLAGTGLAAVTSYLFIKNFADWSNGVPDYLSTESMLRRTKDPDERAKITDYRTFVSKHLDTDVKELNRLAKERLAGQQA